MSRYHPTCDRHTNLQMVPCWVKRPNGVSGGHVCPVPGCGRYHVDGTYLDPFEVELVLSPKQVASTKSALKKDTSNEKTPDRPPNRQTAAREAILRAIQQKQHQ